MLPNNQEIWRKRDTSMKRILYVDFENVSSAGLNGILKLTKNDEVKIFLGPKCSKMSLIEAESVLHCDATVELIKNDQIGKNALDFIIMVHLGYDIAKGTGDFFFIISNDKGYEPAIHEMQSMTGDVIERYPDIEHVIARKDEKPGFFAKLFGKKTQVVDNTTEHEVLNKKGRTGTRSGNGGSHANGHTGTRTDGNHGRTYTPDNRYVNRNRGNNRNGAPRTGTTAAPQQTQQRKNTAPQQAAQKKQDNRPAVKDTTATAANGKDTAAEVKKPVTVKAAAEPKQTVVTTNQTPVATRQTPAETKQANIAVTKAANKTPNSVTEQKQTAVKTVSPIAVSDDSYLDDLSIADLRAQLNVKKEASAGQGAKVASASTQTAKASTKPAEQPARAQSKPAAKVEMTDAERDLVNRALAETDNLGDFHNYILKELRDNDRATEIYKAEKHKVGKKSE